ncbi:MAG: PepSY domain-containing protein [Proteobacteria bacterium]|nr:PepSY domain-containing protein [Pseudomonadota bacterium]
MSFQTSSGDEFRQSNRLYRAVWRWHFYAGLFVAPFLLMLATTGLIILWVTAISPEYGDWLRVKAAGEALRPSAQVEAALAAHPGSSAGKYISPWGSDYPAIVRIDLPEGNRVLAINPYDGAVLRDTAEGDTWNDFITDIHGTLLISGDNGIGDWLIEIAASLAIIVVITGLYLWFPRDRRGIASALLPQLGLRGRALWRSLHQSVGIWISVILLFFVLSGLSWTGVWGSKIVQAWSTFPAEKWDNVPLSDSAHASMNHGAVKEVPWTLEQTLLPESGSNAGIEGLPPGIPANVDSIVALGRAIGLQGRFQVAYPGDDKGVWTISQDSMSYDSNSPTGDRTVHIDQFTGKILADVKFADYPLGGKAMAVGIALHEGQLGWWNVVLNALYCLAVIFACISGIVMWWKRRPASEFGSPRYARGYRVPTGALIAGAILAVLFPLGGIAILTFAIIDFLLPNRLKQAGAA